MNETQGFRVLATVGGGGEGRIGDQMAGWILSRAWLLSGAME